MRASACSSNVGFLFQSTDCYNPDGELAYQWGSIRYAREAATNVRLPWTVSKRYWFVFNDYGSYPTAPHDKVSSITFTFGSDLNLSTTDWRSFCGTFPSKRMLGIEASSSPALIKSSVSLQVENTILQTYQQGCPVSIEFENHTTWHLLDIAWCLLSKFWSSMED